MRDVSELTWEELAEIVTRIVKTLYPNSDPNHEWSADEIEWVAEVLDDYGLRPYDVPQEPEEGDWVTDDHITFREYGGNGVIKVPLGGPWQWAVKDRMERDNFYPNVWSVSDHGNYYLLSLEIDE